jgi:hypothetical protein
MSGAALGPPKAASATELDGMVSRSYAKVCMSSSTQKRTLPISASTASHWLLLLGWIGMLHWHGSMIELITES